MSRPPTGQVLERPGKRGTAFVLRFRAYGRRHWVTVGNTEKGWTRERAEGELRHVLADVERGIWRPPEPPPVTAQRHDPTFHEFASEWLASRRDELRPKTILDYEWQLTHHLLPFFARHRLSAITVADVDRYRQAKVREERLSATSINKTLTRLAQILDVALEYELVDRNAAKGRRRRLKASKPRRAWLEPAQVAPLLEAAGELDAEARVDRRAIPRRALLATLVLAGLRIGELTALRWRNVDLAAGRLAVGESKTDAGRRTVDLSPALRDELAVHKASARFDRAEDRVFPTATGGRQGASNIRNRILAKAVERANEQLQERDLPALPETLTPHSLRHTFASLLFEAGATVPYVMAQLGHTDPKVTLSIYAHVLRHKADTGVRMDELVRPMESPASAEASARPLSTAIGPGETAFESP